MPADTLLTLLFFFLAVAIGWTASRFFQTRTRSKSPSGVGPDYFKGLNYLLEDKHDKAIEVFISMMEVDNETVETHFALGSLFRRRGEVDRAIRIHQNLIARPNLGRQHRDQALFALAEDYLRAGLLDRAEKLFEKLSEHSGKRPEALIKLISIYEQQQDWQQAAAARRNLPPGRSQQNEQIISHYHCEMAQEAFLKRDYVTARQHLKRSQQSGPWLLRGALMRATIAQADDDPKKAGKLLRKIVEHDGTFLTEVWPQLRDTLEHDGAPDAFDQYLAKLVKKRPALSPEVAYAAIVHSDIAHPTASRCVLEFVRSHPALYDALCAMQLMTRDTAPQAPALQRVAAGVRVLLKNRAAYLCADCGYASDRLYWQCPSCKNWDTIRPNTRVPIKRLALAAGK